MADTKTTEQQHDDEQGQDDRKAKHAARSARDTLDAAVSGHDDPARAETRRKRSNELPDGPGFTGDVDELRASGVPEGLLDGSDPDAQLTN